MSHTLDPANARAHHNCSIRRASGFVLTDFRPNTMSHPRYLRSQSELQVRNPGPEECALLLADDALMSAKSDANPRIAPPKCACAL